MASLSWFISSTRINAFDIFTYLKKIVEFKWTKECEEVFSKLKNLLLTPLVLTHPKDGTPLFLYFLVTDREMSFLLIQEKESSENTIYFFT